MIKIVKGQSNTIALTLTEKVSIQNPFFLFEFKDDQANVSDYFISADISSFPERYNKFVITEPSDVAMVRPGMWTYYIREQASSSNLDPLLSGAIVEQGKVKVIGTAESKTTYTPATDTKVVYNG